jgi:hypothetical protein
MRKCCFFSRILVPVRNGICCRFSPLTTGIAIALRTVQILWRSYHSMYPFIYSLYSIQVCFERVVFTKRTLVFIVPVSLSQGSRVNKLWYYLCSHPELWRQLAQQKKWSFSSTLLDQQQIESHNNEQRQPQVDCMPLELVDL